MRLRRVRSEETITLFPFLAVLICTMGSLIVLLVVVVQQARASAETYTESRAEEEEKRQQKIEELQLEKETFDWKIEMLEVSRKETLTMLSDKRLQISHLEDHIRKLRDELARYRSEAKELREFKSADDLDVLRRKLATLIAEQKKAQAEYDKAKMDFDQKAPSYALVPYDGPNGTKRRPIFVECLQDRVIFQPEGIELSGRDFQAPITNDNPLALGLRAKREYLAQLLDRKNEEPYPLLVVRPGGAHAYAAARQAMKAWDSEFGYELVPGNVNLEYEPQDPALVDEIQKAVTDGRERRRQLQRMAPKRFGRATSPSFRVSAQGGFAPTGGNGSRPGSPRHRLGSKTNGNGFGPGQAAESQIGRGFGSFSPEQNPRGESGHEGGLNSSGNHAFAENSDAKSGGNGPANQGENKGDPNRSAQLQSTHGSTGAGATGSFGSAGGSPAEAGGPPGGSPGTSPGSNPPLAAERGADWALPNKSPGATGIVRPISLVCYSDRIILKSDTNSDSLSQSFEFETSVRDQIDPLVAAIWQRMENWRIAGPNMYWKPKLRVTVAPGAEQAHRDLTKLLEGSGIMVKMKK